MNLCVFLKFSDMSIKIMLTINDNSEKDNKSPDEDSSIWIQTPLTNFGPKCIMNKHELCTDSKCECLCHDKKTKQ